MSILDRLFKRKSQASIRNVAELVAPFSAPAIQVKFDDQPSCSHAGGVPNLPAGIEWPTRNGKRLSFLARLSLNEVQQAMPIDWLPQTGALLFFYDLENQPWGFDPSDKGSWAVLHVAELDSPQAAANGQEAKNLSLPFRFAKFVATQSIQSWERLSADSLHLNDAEFDELYRLIDDNFNGQPKHQISGFPYPVQGDTMELEAQLTSHGLNCGDATGYTDPRATELRAGAAEWRLLFQFDSDDTLGVMWGDVGMLYFWVQETQARQGNFQNVWLVMQCH